MFICASVMTILPKTEDFSFLKPTCHVELTQWYSLWKSKEPKDRSSTISATLKEYDELLLSNVSTILSISTVFPVTSHRVRQKSSTTWLVSIISFLIMNLYFKSVCCFRYLYTHTYLPVKQVIDRFLFMCIWQGV